MDKKIYLITLTESVKYNDPVTKHKGVVIGDYRKACALQEKYLYDRLSYWLEKWGYNEEDYHPLEEIFDITKGLNNIFVRTENGDEFLCYVEVVDEF